MGQGAIKWVKPLCFGAVLVLLGDAHAVALSIQGPIVWQLTLPSLRLPAERRAEHSCVSLEFVFRQRLVDTFDPLGQPRNRPG